MEKQIRKLFKELLKQRLSNIEVDDKVIMTGD
jgi:hypothetical protein